MLVSAEVRKTRVINFKHSGQFLLLEVVKWICGLCLFFLGYLLRAGSTDWGTDCREWTSNLPLAADNYLSYDSSPNHSGEERVVSKWDALTTRPRRHLAAGGSDGLRIWTSNILRVKLQIKMIYRGRYFINTSCIPCICSKLKKIIYVIREVQIWQ